MTKKARGASDEAIPSQEERRIRQRQTVRVVATLLLVVAVTLFAVDNRKSVGVGWVFGQGEAPLYLVLVGTSVAGVLVGQLTAWHRRR